MKLCIGILFPFFSTKNIGRNIYNKKYNKSGVNINIPLFNKKDSHIRFKVPDTNHPPNDSSESERTNADKEQNISVLKTNLLT